MLMGEESKHSETVSSYFTSIEARGVGTVAVIMRRALVFNSPLNPLRHASQCIHTYTPPAADSLRVRNALTVIGIAPCVSPDSGRRAE